MSTRYNLLRQPFTSARLTVGAGHSYLDLWVNHAKTGTLTLRNEDVPGVTRALSCDEDVVVQHGTPGGGLRIVERDTLGPATTLISEYGEVTTLARLLENVTHPEPIAPLIP